MKITLSFAHFLSYRNEQTLTLTQQGLVAVQGKNEVSSALDANGVGKSAIFGALCAGWFGVDLNQRRGADLACRHTTERSVVTIHTEDELGAWSVTRTFRPSHTITLDGFDLRDKVDVKVAQELIEQRLGMGVRTFRNAWIFGQGTFDRFARAEQSEQMRIIDELQGLDFRSALDRAKSWRDVIRRQGEDLEENRRRCGERQEQAEEHVRELCTARDHFDAIKQADVAQHQAWVRSSRDALTAAQNLLSQIKQRREQVRKIRAGWAAYQGALQNLQAALRETQEAGRVVEAASEAYRTAQAKFNDLSALPQCPSCRQPVKERLTLIRKAYQEEFARLSKAVTAAKERETRATVAFDREDSVVRLSLAKLPPGTTERAIIAWENETSPAAELQSTRAVEKAQAVLAQHSEALERAQKQSWTGQQALQAVKQTITEAQAEGKKLDTQIRKASLTLKTAEYWVEAFGDRGLRSLLFDSVAPFLSERLAFHLDALAGGEVRVPVSATKPLRGGGTRERLTFTPTWTWGGEGVEAGSGGQDSRFNLALFAAIQDLAEARSARPAPLRIFDEPTAGLDARGRELFLEWIQGESQRRGSAFLISHDLDLAASVRPTHVWTVVLDRNGSRVEVDK